MTENQTPNESFFEESRAYLKSQISLLKLDTVEKLTRIFSTVMLILLTVILASGALLYISFGFIWWSQGFFDSLLPGIFIVSGFFILLIILLYIFRKKWIVNPFVRLFSRIFFTSPNEHEHE